MVSSSHTGARREWVCFTSETQRLRAVLAFSVFFFLRRTSTKSALGRDDNCGEAGEGWVGEQGNGEKCEKEYAR